MKTIKSRLMILTTCGLVLFLSCKKKSPCEGCPENNKAPIAMAGPDQQITLPIDSIMLDGSGSSDADGTITEWLWKKIEGPDFFKIQSASVTSTRVKDLVTGTYVFELTVTDNGGLSTKDKMMVTVNATPARAIDWQKAIGGSRVDIAQSIQPTADGGYIVAGNTNSQDGDILGYHVAVTGCYQTCFGETICDYFPDGVVVKLSNTGAIQWQKALGGSGADNLLSIQPTTDGGYIASGLTYSNDGDVSGFHGGNEADAWVVKLSSIGDIQWQKVLGGGTGCDFANAVLSTTDGGYVVAGHTDSRDGDVTSSKGERDVWIVKLNSGGVIQWEKSLGGSKSDYAYSFQATTDGGYIAVGYTYSNDGDVFNNHGDADAWMVKLSNTGNIEWQKSLGGSNEEIARSIELTGDGGYIVAGSTRSNNGDVNGNRGSQDAWVVKLSNTGTIQWEKSLGGTGDEIGRSIHPTTDGGYAVAGSTMSNNGDVNGNHGGQDAWIVKLSTNGAFQWQKSLGGSANDFANSIHSTVDGGFIVAGQAVSNNGDVSGHHGGTDAWVVKFKP